MHLIELVPAQASNYQITIVESHLWLNPLASEGLMNVSTFVEIAFNGVLTMERFNTNWSLCFRSLAWFCTKYWLQVKNFVDYRKPKTKTPTLQNEEFFKLLIGCFEKKTTGNIANLLSGMLQMKTILRYLAFLS